jgi:hypothetical protein
VSLPSPSPRHSLRFLCRSGQRLKTAVAALFGAFFLFVGLWGEEYCEPVFTWLRSEGWEARGAAFLVGAAGFAALAVYLQTRPRRRPPATR